MASQGKYVRNYVPRVAAAAGGGATPLLTNLLAYWDLSEASGQRNDGHTNAYHLADNNTVGNAAGVGAGQTAALFVQANSEWLNLTYANGASVLVPGTGDWTIGLWCRPDAAATTENLIALGYAPDTEGGALLQTNTAALGRFTARVDDNAGGSRNGLTTGGVGDIRGVFVFVVWKLNRTTDLQIVKANDSAQAWFSSGDDISAVTDIQMHTARSFEVGGSGFGTGSCDARIHAVGIWNRLTTDAEDTWLHNSGTAARLYADVEAYTG